VAAVLVLKDKAVATSGDYEDFFMNDGVRYSHIFDPKTESPVDGDVISATVLSDSCMEADALATALMVMGKEKGMDLIEGMPGVECLLITEGEGIELWPSSGAAVFMESTR
jgi:thiamine biosynthesis lipoprotein